MLMFIFSCYKGLFYLVISLGGLVLRKILCFLLRLVLSCYKPGRVCMSEFIFFYEDDSFGVSATWNYGGRVCKGDVFKDCIKRCFYYKKRNF